MESNRNTRYRDRFILEYYAYECREDRRKEQAKKFCRALRAIGFRAWAQQQLGWQAESTLSREDTTAQNAGASKAIAETLNSKLTEY